MDKGLTHVGEKEGLALLKCYGFNTLETQLATDAAWKPPMRRKKWVFR